MPTDRGELESLCDDWLAAWTGPDPDKLVGFYTEDCFYKDPAKPEGIQGRKHLRGYFAKLLEQHSDMIWRREELFPIEGGFTLKWSASIPCGEEVVEAEGLDVLLLDGGRISHNEVYFDPTDWQAALQA